MYDVLFAGVMDNNTRLGSYALKHWLALTFIKGTGSACRRYYRHVDSTYKGSPREHRNVTNKKGLDMVADPGGLEINNKERAICHVLGSEPRHIHVISRDTGIASQKLSGILLDLALKGVVKQTEGKRFLIL